MSDAHPSIATIVLAQSSPSNFESALDILPSHDDLKILSKDKAFETPVTTHVTQSDIVAALSSENIKADVSVTNSKNRRKQLLICDMDSTLIGQECIDELADFAGVKDRVSAITERAMRGEIGFEGALKERVGLLKGLNLSVLQKCFDKRIHINQGAKSLCRTMKHHGAETVIVSGGFTFFTERIAAACGFEHHQANTLLDDGEKLLGTVGMPILGREAKREALMTFSKKLGGPDMALAIGDGANDLAMIEAAGLGIAYYAKPAVAAAAHSAINHTDLRTALYFQGYSDDEIIDAG